ncbi:MAG: cation diffusion facilitator family transporter [Candidatus Cloacimonetes bacterium]|nr:cation diffusion facilitator family transporter [Candidatus Cloacimonadota bacterium]
MGKKEIQHFRQKEKALLISVIASFVFLIPNIIAVILSNSNIILADTFREGSELLAIFFSYLAIKKVSQGKDITHNYGYGKLESFSSFFIGVVIMISVLIILFHSYNKFLNPVEMKGIGIKIAICTNILIVVFDIWQWKKYFRIKKKSPSPIIEGQWRLYRNKSISDFSVIIALLLGYFLRDLYWARFIDPVGSVLLSCFLIYSAYTIFSMSFDNLMDKTLEERLQLIILRILAKHFDKYERLNDIRSRRSGIDIFIDLYLEFDPEELHGKIISKMKSIKYDLEDCINNCLVNIIPTKGKRS